VGISQGTVDPETGQAIQSAESVASTVADEATNAFDDEVKTLIEKNEGNKNIPYKDTEGYWTVGIGHFIGSELPDEYKDANGNPKAISNAKVQELFEADYAKHKAEAEALPNYDDLDDKGKSVLIDLSFNMGGGKFNATKWPGFFGALADRDIQRAADELVDSNWYRQTKSRGKRMVARMRQARFN
jgi:GH24 family phage-related lysozyme (muramidase)